DLITVVQCQSFTEAAERCNITQSAISQQIKSLEKDLGVKLINRDKRKFKLTEAGEYFYKNCENLLDEYKIIQQEMVKLMHTTKNQLLIGSQDIYCGQELLSATDELIDLHSKLVIRIIPGSHNELMTMLQQDKLDLVFSDLRTPMPEQYFSQKIVSCPGYIAISPRYEISNLTKVTLETLPKLPCILVAQKEHRETEKARFLQNFLDCSQSFIFAATVEEAITMVMNKSGYMPLDYYSATNFRYSKFIRCIPLYENDKPVVHDYYIIGKSKHANKYIDHFVDILMETFKASAK
ncbi:MAG: LysR family transcriptional regulator, partial [Phascolarctobacterium sp.]